MCRRMPSFTEEELTNLHEASMEILRDVGVAFHSPEAIDILKRHGVRVDGSTAYLEESHVRKALENAPSQFTISARHPEKSVVVGGENLVFAPGYGAPFVHTDTGKQRKGTLEDYTNFCKLVQTSKYIDMNGFLMVEPLDLPSETAHLDMVYSNIVFCDKPFMGSAVPRQTAIDTIEMVALAWGGKDKIRDNPVVMPTINPLSPLQWDKDMSEAIIEYAHHGQAIMFENLVMAGSTGPVTLAGSLALQFAEILSGITLAQFVSPGIPVMFGCLGCPTDMRTGNLSIGAPEGSMLVSATAQMAEFYGVPARSGGGITDAHLPDIQAGIESTFCLVTAALAGIHFFLHACGILGSYVAMSYEKFVCDEEICGMIRKLVEPMDISKESLDLHTIKEVGIGGEYFTHPKTLELCRTAFFLTDIMNRQNYAVWRDSGSKTIGQKAREIVQKRLSDYEKPEIDSGIEDDLANYVRKGKNG